MPPLRNDYSGMKVLGKQEFKDLKISEREKGNWLVTDLRTYMKIYINNFKTQGVYDEIIIVDYITPLANLGINIDGEFINKQIYSDDKHYNDLAHVFTKLHMLKLVRSW